MDIFVAEWILTGSDVSCCFTYVRKKSKNEPDLSLPLTRVNNETVFIIKLLLKCTKLVCSGQYVHQRNNVVSRWLWCKKSCWRFVL